MSKKYFIETYGCQMNVHDSERMSGLLDHAGYERAETDIDADIVVINTCSVRERAEEKIYTRLGELRLLEAESGRRRTVAVTGCVAQQEGDSLGRRTNGHVIDIVLGTQQIKQLPALVDRATGRAGRVVEVGPLDDVTFPLGIARHSDAVRAYVTIIEGCNDHCSFCVVPHTRGHERMRRRMDILADVRAAADTGRQEIHLLGQIVNHYEDPDDGCDFAQLLADVNEVPGVTRIRFASPHPRHTGARLIEAVRSLSKVCKHLHLPVQSGSTRVLKAMRRRHTREEYLDLLQRIREAIPGVTFSTDVIVGFPGETVEDFNDTMTLTDLARFHGMFSFKYSPRPNTLAAMRMPDDVAEDEKTRRIVALQARQREIQTRLHQASVGSVLEVLVDSVSRHREFELSGKSMANAVVKFAAPSDTSGVVLEQWIGRTVDVRIESASPHNLRGQAISRAMRVPC